MISEQTSGHLRQLLQGLGGIATALGWLTTGQVDIWIQIILQVIGPGFMAYGYLWSWWVNRPTALVASVVAMADDPGSPVKGVLTAPTMAGRDLAKEFESNKIAPVGTHDAKVIAATAP